MTAKEYMIDRVAVPKWVITLITPVIVGAIIGFGTYRYSAGEDSKQLKTNTEQINKITTEMTNKVNYQPEFKMVMDQLNRIEGKLDNHISSK